MAALVGSEGASKPGRAKYSIEHVVELNWKEYRHCFACVQWYKEYSTEMPFRNLLSVAFNGIAKLKFLRVIVHKIQTLAGHCTSPISLKFGMQSCFRVLTTK